MKYFLIYLLIGILIVSWVSYLKRGSLKYFTFKELIWAGSAIVVLWPVLVSAMIYNAIGD